MAIKRMRTQNFVDFAEFVQENLVPSIFKAATYDSATGTLTCTDDEDNTALVIKGGSTSVGSGYYFRAYRTFAGSYIGQTFNAFPNTSGGGNLDVVSCDNGMICTASVVNTSGYGKLFCFLIAKTNADATSGKPDGKPAIIFAGLESSMEMACRQNIDHVALGDSATISTKTSFTPENAQQTTLCPFGTNADVGTASYTTDAYYMPMGQNYNSGLAQFSIGNDRFITNGYWAVRTGGDE